MTKSVASPTGRVEGVGSSGLPTWWTSHPLQTSLPTLRRTHGGGGGSPPRRQHRNEATTGLLRGYYESYYEATTRLLRGYYVATTRPLPGHYQATTRLPRDYYQEPPARHSASSTAAAAPLVCRRRSRQQLGADADDPAHQRKYLEEAVLHLPNKLDNSEDQARHISLCSRMQLACSPACTPTSPTKTSTSSEPAWAKWNMMELFMTDRHQHLPAATMLHVLDSTPLRHSRTSQCGRAAGSRRAAAAARRSARGPHAPRSGSRARTAATSDTSAATHRRLPSREISIYLKRYSPDIHQTSAPVPATGRAAHGSRLTRGM